MPSKTELTGRANPPETDLTSLEMSKLQAYAKKKKMLRKQINELTEEMKSLKLE
jgi:hypothetical protein